MLKMVSEACDRAPDGLNSQPRSPHASGRPRNRHSSSVDRFWRRVLKRARLSITEAKRPGHSAKRRLAPYEPELERRQGLQASALPMSAFGLGRCSRVMSQLEPVARAALGVFEIFPQHFNARYSQNLSVRLHVTVVTGSLGAQFRLTDSIVPPLWSRSFSFVVSPPNPRRSTWLTGSRRGIGRPRSLKRRRSRQVPRRQARRPQRGSRPWLPTKRNSW